MTYSTEYDENHNIIKEYETDEYGNVDITYINEEIKNVDTLGLFTHLICSYKLQLSINKSLYEKGSISESVYQKVENKLLERLKPLLAIMEV